MNVLPTVLAVLEEVGPAISTSWQPHPHPTVSTGGKFSGPTGAASVGDIVGVHVSLHA